MAGDGATGAYVCQLTITSDGLTLAPGGPGTPFVAPAAREYAAPVVAVATAAQPPVNEVNSAPEPTHSLIDLMRFSKEKKPLEEKLQSSKTGYLGSPRMNRKELAKLSAELKTIGVQLIVDKKGVLPSFARAGFNPTNGKL